MSIVKMKRLRLLAVRDDRDTILRGLRDLGCVELRQPRDLPEGWSLPPVSETEALAAANDRANALRDALEVLKKQGAPKKKMLEPLPQVSHADFFDEAAYAEALRTAAHINETQRDLNGFLTQKGKLEHQRAQLAPWLEIPADLSMTGTRETALVFAAVPLKVDRQSVLAAFDAVTDLYDVTWAGEDRENRCFLLLCHRSAKEDLLSALLNLGGARVRFKDRVGPAMVHDAALQGELKELQEWIDGAQDRLAGMKDQYPALQQALDRANQDAALERAKAQLLDTRAAFLLEGWLPADREGDVAELLSRCPTAVEFADPTEEEYPQVPVKLKNGPLSSPMNMVTEMYSLPAYDGIDPNPLMMPFFVLFYGIMMADMAYGLIMMLAGFIGLKKMKPRGTMKHLLGLLGLCGVTTFAVGALTGGFFGDFIPQVLRIVNPASTFEMPALFTPLNDTLAILIGSLVLGFIQVIAGMAISFVKQTREGRFLDALLNEGAWWVIFAGAALAILGAGSVGGVPVVLCAGLLMLIAGCIRQTPSFAVLGTLVGAVYNGVTGVFQDVLSYSRLMALMLSGSIIASVFNTLGSITGNVVAFVIISMIGNTLNFVLNILGCFVHDLRLQCLEFFGKFYKDGGKPFKPLSVDTKYVNVTQHN